jgi:hypothetical protein
MRKYKGQTLVSVVGLAVGFVCFAMSTLWIRHEMTYDNFHKNADRIYCVGEWDNFYSTGRRRDFPRYLAGYLKSTFPEVANAIAISLANINFKYEDVNHKADFLLDIDSSFFSMFDVKIIEGSMDFLIPESGKIAITREKALQLFGNESPVGKKITINNYSSDEFEICAVVTGFPKRSNYPFDFLRGTHVEPQLQPEGHFVTYLGQILVEIVPGIDMKAFEKKLNEHEFPRMEDIVSINATFTLIPLTAVHHKDPDIKIDSQFRRIERVQIQHIIIFALAGLLLILCTLFNYLTLFVSRFRIRQRELALRTIYGA